MNNFKVSEIQYLNRDYCQLFSKPLVYLHYVNNSYKYPNASYQHVLKNEAFNEDTTNEEIINEFKDYSDRVINASQKAKLLTFIKDFQLEYPGLIDDIHVYPNYSVEIVDISNANDTTPDLSLVWEINRIAPTMCGMLFENIISETLQIKSKPYDLSELMTSNKSNIPIKTIENTIERNFIKRELIHRSKHVRIVSKKYLYVGDEKLKDEHFITIWHYLVFMSLLHFMKRDLTGKDFENALNILD